MSINITEIDIETVDDLERYSKKIESMIRTSLEYKSYIADIIETNSIHQGCYFSTVNFSTEKKLTFQLHHLITLYNIVIMTGTKMLLEKTPEEHILTWDIAEAVIYLHLHDMLPVCMLEQTLHEMLHSGDYSIPEDSPNVHLGKYREFLSVYKDYLSDEELSVYSTHGVSPDILADIRGTPDE